MYPAKPSQLGPPTGEDPPDDVPELEPPPSSPAPESPTVPLLPLPDPDPVPPPELEPPLPEPELVLEPMPELEPPELDPEPEEAPDKPDDEAPSLPPDEDPPVPPEEVSGLAPHAARTIHAESGIDCKAHRTILTTDPSRPSGVRRRQGVGGSCFDRYADVLTCSLLTHGRPRATPNGPNE
jgi:hypothetical protein